MGTTEPVFNLNGPDSKRLPNRLLIQFVADGINLRERMAVRLTQQQVSFLQSKHDIFVENAEDPISKEELREQGRLDPPENS